MAMPARYLYLQGMGNQPLLCVLLGVITAAVVMSCSSPPSQEISFPTPTPTVSSRLTVEKAAAFMRAVIIREPGCASIELQDSSFTPTWEPSTKSWLVNVKASQLGGNYRIFEDRGFSVETVNPLIAGKC